MPLTARQERFVEEYLVDLNGAQAAIRAGCREKSARKTASKWLTNADILARVREKQAEQTQRLAISADFVLQQLVETLNRCMAAQPVMVWDPATKQKVESGTYTFDSRGALRALELIGKHLGMFEDRMRVSAAPDTGILSDVLAQLWEPERGDPAAGPH